MLREQTGMGMGSSRRHGLRRRRHNLSRKRKRRVNRIGTRRTRISDRHAFWVCFILFIRPSACTMCIRLRLLLHFLFFAFFPVFSLLAHALDMISSRAFFFSPRDSLVFFLIRWSP